jgi:acyl-CoA thioesterase FadM
MTTSKPTPALLAGETMSRLRPRYEGLNINSWIGFKHISYLVEEAVLEHFRTTGVSAHTLFEDHGLCVELVDLDTRITTAIHTDDLVEAVVQPSPVEPELAFTVSLFVERSGERKKAARSNVRVVLRQDGVSEPAETVPAGLEPFVTNRIVRTGSQPASVPSQVAELTAGANAFAWRWRIPYFYCHFSERLQLSGYLRQLEEVVDLFLADRGVSIKRLLDEQRWIPLVTHSSVTMLEEVAMEEELWTVFTVDSIFKNFTYTARMDTYVLRDERLLRTATGRITHAYGEIVNRREIKLVEFDRRLRTALEGG